jgi:hypothetical protein
VLITNQRAFDSHTQAIDLQTNLRDAAAILPNELRELDAVDGDIIAMTDSSITLRSMRQLGIVCSPPVLGAAYTGRTFIVRPLRSSVAAFAVGDSVLFWYEGNPIGRGDEGWVAGKITAIAAAPVVCPGEVAVTATSMTADLVPFVAPYTNTAGYLTAGSPIRGYRQLSYTKYRAPDGKYYLALLAAQYGATPVPIVGPLAGSTGLVFTYYDAAGAVTAARTAVSQIRIALRAQTAKAIQLGNGQTGPSSDGYTLAVTLRNNPRY